MTLDHAKHLADALREALPYLEGSAPGRQLMILKIRKALAAYDATHQPPVLMREAADALSRAPQPDTDRILQLLAAGNAFAGSLLNSSSDYVTPEFRKVWESWRGDVHAALTAAVAARAAK